MSLFVIRHGKTDWNSESRVQGQSNIKLNEMGIKQAENIREKIENRNIDIIICSPLDRTKQTAEIINKNMDLPIMVDDRIKERNFGIFEGKKTREIEEWKEYLKYHKNKELEEGEKIQDFFSRIFDFASEIEKEAQDKNILVVTHGGVARGLECYFKGIPDDEEDVGSSMLDTCEVREYEMEKKWKQKV